MYRSYDEYCDTMGPDKLIIKPEVLTRVTSIIRDSLIESGDTGFENEDLAGAVLDWERSDEDADMAIVSIELFDGEKFYSREFTFTECGIVSRLRS